MFNRPEFKVGLLVIVSFVVIGYMSMKVAQGISFFKPTNDHKIMVSDASGIIPNTAVKMAGVQVGQVKSIKLKNGQAEITITVDKDVGLSDSTFAEFKTDGILGTKHISLNSSSGLETEKAPLESGSSLPVVTDTESLGSVLKQIGAVAESLSDVADAIKEAAVKGNTDTPIGKIVGNLERLTSDLAEVSSQNKDEFNSIVNKMDGIVTTLNEVMGEGARSRVNKAFDSAYSGLEKFDAALVDIKEVTRKINEGEGTVGRLINDEETINGVNEVVDNFNSLLGGARTLRTSFDYHSEYLTEPGEIRSFLGIRLQPGPDRYYEIGIIQDPFGFDTTKSVSQTGSQNAEYTETITSESKIRVTALFAKNFYDFTVKGGLIESTGGFGLDYTAMNKKLRLSAELFNFEDSSLRLFARYDIYNGVYVVGGYNTLFADERTVNSAFFGAGIFLRNDDLATLASFAFRR